MISILIKEGHPPDIVADYSIAQLILYVDVINKRNELADKENNNTKGKSSLPKANTVISSYRESPFADRIKRKGKRKR